MSTPSRRELVLDLLLLAAALLLLHRGYLVPGSTLQTHGFTDLGFLAYPAFSFTARSLLDGSFPFWNPYLFAGYPHFAMPESAVLYPTTWLYGLAGFAFVAKCDLLLHLLVLGGGAYLLGRDLFGQRLPALLLGLLSMAGSTSLEPQLGGQLWLLHTLVWFPLDLLLLRRILAHGRWAPALGLAALLGLQALAGAPQALVYALLACAAYVGFELLRRLLQERQSVRVLGGRAGLCLVAVALGLALAAVQLLSSQELLAQSIRAQGVTADYFYGRTLFMTELSAGIFVDQLLFRLQSFLPGALTLALILLGLSSGARSERFSFAFIAFVCGFYMVLPDWAYEHLVRHVPGLGSGRFNTRIAFFMHFSAFVLAGYGLARLAEPGQAARRLWLLLAMWVLLASLAPVLEQPTLRPLVLPVGLAALATAAWAVRRGPVAWAVPALALLVAVEGIHFHQQRMVYGRARNLNVDADLLAFSRARRGLDRQVLFFSFNWKPQMHQNIGVITEDRLLGGAHALMLDSYATFMQEVLGVDLFEKRPDGKLHRQKTGFLSTDWLTPESLRALDLLNVRYLVSKGMPLPVAEARLPRTAQGALTIYENPEALPVAFLVHRAERVEDASAARARLLAPGFEPRSRVLLTEDFDASRLGPPRGPEVVELSSYQGNQVEIGARLSAGGILVLTDVDYPGWRVEVDGEPAPLLRVDALLRGVQLDAGSHRVRFWFRPTHLVPGAAISGLALLVLVVGLWRTRPARGEAGRQPA